MREKLKIAPGNHGFVLRYTGRHPSPRRFHSHEELEFNLVVAGTATCLVGNRRYEMGRDSLIWLFPGEEHVLISRSADLAMWVVVFQPAMIRDACRTERNRFLREWNPPGFHLRTLRPSAARELAILCRSGSQEEETDHFNATLRLLLLNAWRHYNRQTTALDYAAVHPSVARAADLLARGSPESKTVDRLAGAVGLSRSQLLRLFPRQIGLTVSAFRNRHRLERFRYVREARPEVGLLEAAMESGFGSYAQFHRVFRAHHGYSPSRQPGSGK